MHTCPPPKEVFEEKFKEYPDTNGNFGHTLLEQIQADDGSLAESLREYFESAHLDARNLFHADIGIDLHPDANESITPITYPSSLPSTTRRGLFGEVLTGLLTETYEYVGQHNWCVPIFLFRFHDDAFQYLFSLARDPNKKRQTIGRLGSDFIGISLDQDGEVIRIISGEAKWRETLTQSVADNLMLGDWIKKDKKKKKGKDNRIRSGKGVWYYVNNEPSLPSGVRQLQRLLQEHAPNSYDNAILSLQKALIVKNPKPIPKTDLIVIAGNSSSKRESRTCYLPFEEIPPEYTAGNELQIVEIFFVEGEKLIDTLYSSLWAGGDDACP